MTNKQGNAGTSGTTGAEHLRTILSAFGSPQWRLLEPSAQIMWTHPRTGQHRGCVALKGSRWVAVLENEKKALVWVDTFRLALRVLDGRGDEP